MNGLLNMGSLILGLMAWVLPAINLVKYKKDKNKNWNAFAMISITACAISIYFQIYVTYNLVEMSDWAAIGDTIGAVTFVSLVLLIITITLNSVVAFLYYEKRK